MLISSHIWKLKRRNPAESWWSNNVIIMPAEIINNEKTEEAENCELFFWFCFFVSQILWRTVLVKLNANLNLHGNHAAKRKPVLQRSKFQVVKSDKGLYSAFCPQCRKYLTNTAANRLRSHRYVCRYFYPVTLNS